MNIKSKVLNYLYYKYQRFFNGKILEELKESQRSKIKEEELESLYRKNKSVFEGFLVKDFIGFIPENINEPTLKIFEDHAEIFQRWIFWQSWYINRRSLHDKENIEKYDGMMIYLKVLFLMAEANKKAKPTIRKPISSKPEQSFLETAMQGVDDFKNYGKEKEQVAGTETTKDE